MCWGAASTTSDSAFTRDDESVDLDEFTANYEHLLDLLAVNSQRVICVEETPIAADDAIDVTAANGMLRHYNAVAAGVAADRGIAFVTVWEPFIRAEALLPDGGQVSLYSDGVHLSPYGDACCMT